MSAGIRLLFFYSGFFLITWQIHNKQRTLMTNFDLFIKDVKIIIK